jgi:hypothetical protein
VAENKGISWKSFSRIPLLIMRNARQPSCVLGRGGLYGYSNYSGDNRRVDIIVLDEGHL